MFVMTRDMIILKEVSGKTARNTFTISIDVNTMRAQCNTTKQHSPYSYIYQLIGNTPAYYYACSHTSAYEVMLILIGVD